MPADEPGPIESPSRRERFAWYAGAAFVTTAVLFFGMRLDVQSLKTPLSYGGGTVAADESGAYGIFGAASRQMPDVLLIMPMVKATLERGSHWQNERMGYPGILQLYDFPVIDHLHLALIWLLGQVDWFALPGLLLALLAPMVQRRLGSLTPLAASQMAGIAIAVLLGAAGYFALHTLLGGSARYWNYVEVYNGYYLLTYPLTTLTAMAVFRWMGLSLPMAAVGGLLYAFLPYHYLRGEAHYFLAAYWVVPLSWLPALAVCRGRLPFFRTEPGGTHRLEPFSRTALWQVLLAAATASAGAYYAFFACAIYAFAGVYQSAVMRSVKPAISMGLVAGLVMAFGLANHLPALVYTREHQRNAVTDRLADEAERYGLKFAHLVLPVDGHNFLPFGQLKSRYDSSDRPLQTENTCATLGLVGSVGFLMLLVSVLATGCRNWPYRPLGALTWFMFLYGTIGGLASVFNLLIFDQIRCPNRISIYLAFIAIFASLYALDRFLLSRTGRTRQFRYPVIAGVALLGIADQTPTPWFTGHIAAISQANADRFRDDRSFFSRVEERMPPGGRIFCMPYMRYPEEPPLHAMNTYEHARGYLHTDTLVWSYGAMKQREHDAWQENVYHGARDQLIRRLVVRGFDGIFIDLRGYLPDRIDHGERMLNDLKSGAESNGRVKLPLLIHPDGRQAFMDIRPYRDWLQAQDPVKFEDWRREEAEWVALTWLRGSASFEAYGMQHLHRWMFRSTTAMIVNPSDRTRTFRFVASFGSDRLGEFQIRIRGDSLNVIRPDGIAPWQDDFTINLAEVERDAPKAQSHGIRKEYLLQVPPGRHFVTFKCTPPFDFMPSDSRPICYYLHELLFYEVK
jgi:hypothetical protein